MVKVLLVAIGGAVGSVLRYLCSGLTYRILGETFPWGTLVVNLLGCFTIGFLWALSERAVFSARVHPFVFTGILGGFTTFSTFGLESFNLIREGEVGSAVMNLVASNLFGLFCVAAGFISARYLISLTGKTP